MSDVAFSCLHCNRNLSAAEDMEGATISCPSCGNMVTVPIRIVIPKESGETTSDATNTQGADTCPYCRMPLKPGGPLKVCPSCATPHHAECWNENKGCTVFGCKESPGDEEKITVATQTHASPTMSRNGGPAAPPQPKKNAPGAGSSIGWGILGFFFCGLIFGIVAITEANKAKKLIRTQPELYTGEGLATAGLVIGIVQQVPNIRNVHNM